MAYAWWMSLNKTTKKGDIALDMIFTIVIAIVAITILFAFFGQVFEGFPKKVYCQTFFKLVNDLPGRDIRSTECIDYIRLEEYIIEPIKDIDLLGNVTIKCEIGKAVMANVVACWQKSEFGRSSKNFLCKNVIVSEECPIDLIQFNESNATDVLIQEGVCKIISNNDIQISDPMGISKTCGDSDQIEWLISSIGKQRSVLIEYKDNRIIVS